MKQRLLHDKGNSRRCGPGNWIGLGLAMAAGAAFLTMAPCACKPRTEPASVDQQSPVPPATAVAPAEAAATDAVPQEQKLPRLLDLGAHKCIPCKMMEPILEELKKEYAGVFKTDFIDVWQNADAGTQYGIQSIPTQIFFDADGKELFRHVGFFAKEDILATWKKHGVDVELK